MTDLPTEQPLASRRPDLVVAPADLRFTCDADCFDFATTAEVVAPEGTVGQERAAAALELGLAVRSGGHHVFVSGPVGTGRSTAVRAMLARLAPTLPVPPDRAYAQRFDQPDRPRLLTLEPGTAPRLAAELDELRDALTRRIPALLEDRDLERRREEVGRRYARGGRRRPGRAARRPSRATAWRWSAWRPAARCTPRSPPLQEGKPVPFDEAAQGLDEAAAADLRGRLEARSADVREYLRANRDRQRAFAREVRDLVVEAGGAVVDEELRRGARAVPAARRRGVPGTTSARTRSRRIVDVLDNGQPALERMPARLARYRVNVLADRTGEQGAPVVDERFPSRQNLAGSVERVQEGPFAYRADASTIRGGSLLRADGGLPRGAGAGPAGGARRLGRPQAHHQARRAGDRRRGARRLRPAAARWSPIPCPSTSRSC